MPTNDQQIGSDKSEKDAAKIESSASGDGKFNSFPLATHEGVIVDYVGVVASKVRVGKGLLLIGLRVSSDMMIECGVAVPNFTIEEVKLWKNDIHIGDRYSCSGFRNGRVPKKSSELLFSIDCTRIACLEHCVLGNTGEYRQVNSWDCCRSSSSLDMR